VANSGRRSERAGVIEQAPRRAGMRRSPLSHQRSPSDAPGLRCRLSVLLVRRLLRRETSKEPAPLAPPRPPPGGALCPPRRLERVRPFSSRCSAHASASVSASGASDGPAAACVDGGAAGASVAAASAAVDASAAAHASGVIMPALGGAAGCKMCGEARKMSEALGRSLARALLAPALPHGCASGWCGDASDGKRVEHVREQR